MTKAKPKHHLDGDSSSSNFLSSAFSATNILFFFKYFIYHSLYLFIKVVSRRWTKDLDETPDFYFDMEIKDVSKKLKEYPPDNLDLSDAWVVAIVDSKLTREERGASWPTVFTNRGALRAHYVHKGQAAKLYDAEAKGIKYALLFGEHNMIDTEGMKEGLPTRRPSILSEADQVTHGLIAQMQDMKYDEEEAEAEAAAARNITENPKATKKTIAPRSTGFTPINRQAVPNVKKSTAADEENDPEDEPARKPATRYSKRLLEKTDVDSEAYILQLSSSLACHTSIYSNRRINAGAL